MLVASKRCRGDHNFVFQRGGKKKFMPQVSRSVRFQIARCVNRCYLKQDAPLCLPQGTNWVVRRIIRHVGLKLSPPIGYRVALFPPLPANKSSSQTSPTPTPFRIFGKTPGDLIQRFGLPADFSRVVVFNVWPPGDSIETTWKRVSSSTYWGTHPRPGESHALVWGPGLWFSRLFRGQTQAHVAPM